MASPIGISISVAGLPFFGPARPLPRGGGSIEAPGAYTAGTPVGGPSSLFNIAGSPIAILGGVFSGGLPLGGPVTQIFRGGSSTVPPTLPLSTLSPSGPIGAFLIGTSGAPIGVAAFGGGGLPIGPPSELVSVIEQVQPRTALISASTFAPPPTLVFGGQLPPLAPSPLPVAVPIGGGTAAIGAIPIGPGGGFVPGGLSASGGVLLGGGGSPISGGGAGGMSTGGRPIGG